MNPTIRGKLTRVFAVLPALILSTVVNVFIVTIVSHAILFGLIDRYNKNVSLAVAIVSAVAVYAWILNNHKLKLTLSSKEQ